MVLTTEIFKILTLYEYLSVFILTADTTVCADSEKHLFSLFKLHTRFLTKATEILLKFYFYFIFCNNQTEYFL